ncbi:MAG TPA: hypothetical protein VLJ39_11050 [Tepidisphaeraceae bacterium]|nr:hypothetical protein [Tepidisphaeraceae bacterium]
MKLPRGTFLVADLSAGGELRVKSEYRYDLLEQIPGAAELIGRLSGLLWRSPEEFEEPLTGPRSRLQFRWRSSSETSGIATLRCEGELISVTLLCSGLSEDQDRLTLEAFQTHLLRELRDTGFEPAFGLMDLPERPLAATVNFHSPADVVDQHVAALTDRCFAAAYFRYQNLA